MEDAGVRLDSHLVLSPTQDGPVIPASIQTVNQLKSRNQNTVDFQTFQRYIPVLLTFGQLQTQGLNCYLRVCSLLSEPWGRQVVDFRAWVECPGELELFCHRVGSHPTVYGSYLAVCNPVHKLLILRAHGLVCKNWTFSTEFINNSDRYWLSWFDNLDHVVALVASIFHSCKWSVLHDLHLMSNWTVFENAGPSEFVATQLYSPEAFRFKPWSTKLPLVIITPPFRFWLMSTP